MVSRSEVGELQRRRADLHRAVAAGDASALRVSAHTLVGALASLGATPARRLAADLERLGQENRLGGAAETLARLEAELDRLVAFVATPGWEEPPITRRRPR